MSPIEITRGGGKKSSFVRLEEGATESGTLPPEIKKVTREGPAMIIELGNLSRLPAGTTVFLTGKGGMRGAIELGPGGTIQTIAFWGRGETSVTIPEKPRRGEGTRWTRITSRQGS